MGFGRGLSFVFNGSWAFIRKAWWIALIPSLPLFGHDIGSEYLHPAWVDAAFWAASALTAILQSALIYCVMRFLALEQDVAAALAINRDSARTFAPYFVAISALTMAALTLGVFYTAGPVWWVLALLTLVGFPLLSVWSVTAPSGTTVIGPVRSIKLVLPHTVWAVALTLVTIVPVLILLTLAAAIIAALPDVTLAGQSLQFWASAAVEAVVSACSDLLLVVSLFVIAQKAGVRIGDDRALSVVFE